MGGQPARSGRYLGNGLLTPYAGLGSDISLPAKLEEMLPETQLLRTWTGKELSSLQMEYPLRTNREAGTANLVCAQYTGVLGLRQHCFPSLSLRPHVPAPPEAHWQPPRLAARDTFRLETELRPAVRLSSAPPIWTSGSKAPFAVSAPPPHTPGLWLPAAGRAALGLVFSLSLSQQPPPRISPRPGFRAELGRGRAVPQPSRPVSRDATWLCAPAADRAFPGTSRVVPGTQGPREALRAAWPGSSPPPPGPRGAFPARCSG